jgi:hypothetical protein
MVQTVQVPGQGRANFEGALSSPHRELAVVELLPSSDMLSMIVKSSDSEYDSKITKGLLRPVLDAIKQVHRAGNPLERSRLGGRASGAFSPPLKSRRDPRDSVWPSAGRRLA